MNPTTKCDFIGDIHGHAKELKILLKKLGYNENGNHPDNRKIVFLGDYIDRGPEIKEVLTIVRNLTTSQKAFAILGNHELNAVLYHTPNEEGGFLREHSKKNIKQHSETITQLGEEIQEWLLWFKSLPLWLEFENFRAVHAYWNKEHINTLNAPYLFMHNLSDLGNKEHPINLMLKGIELPLPEGFSIIDKEGDTRKEIRVKWWIDPKNQTYKSLQLSNLNISIKEEPAPSIAVSEDTSKYIKAHQGVPTFIGHYWFNGNPSIIQDNLVCLDYSIAKKEKLCAYRFDGEKVLSNNKFVYVEYEARN